MTPYERRPWRKRTRKSSAECWRLSGSVPTSLPLDRRTFLPILLLHSCRRLPPLPHLLNATLPLDRPPTVFRTIPAVPRWLSTKIARVRQVGMDERPEWNIPRWQCHCFHSITSAETWAICTGATPRAVMASSGPIGLSDSGLVRIAMHRYAHRCAHRATHVTSCTSPTTLHAAIENPYDRRMSRPTASPAASGTRGTCRPAKAFYAR